MPPGRVKAARLPSRANLKSESGTEPSMTGPGPIHVARDSERAIGLLNGLSCRPGHRGRGGSHSGNFTVTVASEFVTKLPVKPQ